MFQKKVLYAFGKQVVKWRVRKESIIQNKREGKKRIQNIRVCNHHSNQMNIQNGIKKWVHYEKLPH